MRCEDTARKEEEGITRNYISKGGREIHVVIHVARRRGGNNECDREGKRVCV